MDKGGRQRWLRQKQMQRDRVLYDTYERFPHRRYRRISSWTIRRIRIYRRLNISLVRGVAREYGHKARDVVGGEDLGRSIRRGLGPNQWSFLSILLHGKSLRILPCCPCTNWDRPDDDISPIISLFILAEIMYQIKRSDSGMGKTTGDDTTKSTSGIIFGRVQFDFTEGAWRS